MNDFDRWKLMCAAYDEADKKMRRLMQVVTDQMEPSGGGDPSLADLQAFAAARDSLAEIRGDINDFISERIGR